MRLRIRTNAGIAALLCLLFIAGKAVGAKQHPPIPTQTGEKNEASSEAGGACVSCHAEKAKQKVVHPAVTQMGCESCHEASQKNGQWEVKLVAAGNDLCFMCHDDKKPAAKEGKVRTHSPVAEGECVVCHDPHGSDNPLMLPGPVDVAGEDNFCFTCHPNIAELTKKTDMHPALAIGGCSACHKTHKSGDPSEQQFAFHLTDSAPALCLSCHDAKDADLAKAHSGQPFQTAVCTGCHNPHGSDAAKLIRPYSHPPFEARTCDACHNEPKDGKVSLIEDGKKELCFTCHDDKKELLEKAKVKHSYFDVDDTCTTCHSPHASDQPKWLRKPIRQVCSGCHEEGATEFKITHGPLEAEKSCIICHEPHASDFPLHMRAKIEDLCINCHRMDRSFPTDEKGDLQVFENVTVPPSIFKNCPVIPIRTVSEKGHPLMDHPVSGPNVLRPEKGDINCASCHNPHGITRGKKLLSIFGNELCLSCHGDQKPKATEKKAEVKR